MNDPKSMLTIPKRPKKIDKNPKLIKNMFYSSKRSIKP